jgi:RecJ-like exonuclease
MGENVDLSRLAIVGAVGDFQDNEARGLQGFNRRLVQEAVDAKYVRAEMDLRYFGRETRPLAKFLQFSSDPTVPGVSGDAKGCAALLSRLGIDEKRNGKWRSWSTLSQGEKGAVISELADRIMDAGGAPSQVQRLVGECYSLVTEKEGTEVRDAKEFSTLLNSCGRYGKAKVGLSVCCGDRNEEWEKSLVQLRQHRENMKEAMDTVKSLGVERQRFAHLQFIRGRDGFCVPVEDTVVGIVAGMLLGSGDIPDDRPIVAFAESLEANGEIRTKVSARGTKPLVARGLDLSAAMKEAAEACGGTGGGHNIAAGATIPEGKELEFLSCLDGIFAVTVQR